MNRVAVFAKPPVAGRVKTRLSPAWSAEQACALYRGMLDDALAAAAASGAGEASVWWAEDPSSGVPVAVPPRMSVHRQTGDDLGARLIDAFASLLVAPDDRAVVIGADCPTLDSSVVDQAFAELARHDLVLGPTRDGGYYLIGLRRPTPSLFEGIPWSTHAVLGETLERAERAELETVLLAMRDDLDTDEDLRRLVASGGRRAQVGGATLASLRDLGLLAG